MKVLFVSHEFPPIGGGGANACKNLANELCKLGHNVDIVTSNYCHMLEEENKGQMTIYRVNSLRKERDKSTFIEMLSFLLLGIFKSEKLARSNRYDLCLVFFGIPSGPIGLILKKKYDIPYIVRFGGGDIPGAQKRYSFLYKLLAPIVNCIWKNADALVANSESLKERALQFNNKNNVNIIPNGVDSSVFFRTSKYSLDDEIRLLFVSRLIEGKGLQFVIPRLREINDKVGKRVSLSIVGDGPYREKLEEIIIESNVEEYVTLKGRKDGSDLINEYDSANLFILPSLSEGMPNVVLEAMAMGLPIIMTDCGGSTELICNNGVVARIEDFVPCLIELCKKQELLYCFHEESERRARRMFDWATVAMLYLGLVSNEENVCDN